MAFFRWAAPLFNRAGYKWRPEDAGRIASWLRPFVPEDGRVLDLGGGTGALAVPLADALRARVTVLDATPEMLAYVPQAVGVEAILGCAEAIPFPDATFDAVVVSDAFHHFADQDAAAQEMRRVARRGGAVLVLELDPSGRAMRVIARAEKLLGEPGAFFTPSEMCAFFARHGIDGRCEPTRPPGYRFLGVVRPERAAKGD